MTRFEEDATSRDADAVREVNTALWNAVEQGDIDRLGEVWADGPEASGVTCVHPGWPALRGRAEVLRSYALIMANTSYVQFFLTDVEVRVNGDTAVLTCTVSMLTDMGIEEDGDETGFAGGREVVTNVFVRSGAGRTDGSPDRPWRLWLHHASPVLAESDDEEG